MRGLHSPDEKNRHACLTAQPSTDWWKRLTASFAHPYAPPHARRIGRCANLGTFVGAVVTANRVARQDEARRTVVAAGLASGLLRVVRSSPGHLQRVSLSPVSAISDMVAPVVLITLATIFANGLLTAATTFGGRISALKQERLGILRGPHGEMLDEDSVPPLDRERLTEIGDQMPLLIRRTRHIRSAVLIIWIAIGLLVLSVAAIAAAVTARSEAVAFTALALVMAGVAGIFAGIAAVIGPLARSADPLLDETRRTGMLG
jgi:hypothetical protein